MGKFRGKLKGHLWGLLAANPLTLSLGFLAYINLAFAVYDLAGSSSYLYEYLDLAQGLVISLLGFLPISLATWVGIRVRARFKSQPQEDPWA